MKSIIIITGCIFSMLAVSSCIKAVIPIPKTVDSLVSTVAGNGIPGYLNGIDSGAEFYAENALTIDNQGNIFVADLNRIRKISPNGMVSTFAGTDQAGYINGTTNAEFDYAYDLKTDVAGNMYVADNRNNVIRKISPTGLVSTFAGNGSWGYVDGPSSNAEFHNPAGMTIDAAGNIFLADLDNFRIRKISTTGVVSTIAGSGIEGFLDGDASVAQFDEPSSVAVDLDGNIYVADLVNNRIRKISVTGMVSTFAGNGTPGFGDGPGSNAEFNGPSSIVIDHLGNIYVADTGNNRIRKITPDGLVSTIAGNGTAGYTDGALRQASFNIPIGVALDSKGNLYVADYANFRIRKITLQ
ncbi:MAG TPA: NHL repeat-containing protein [Puia sp.]|jgi:sugar lactone lactonase YvrE|nr:NHL repeat-containing protein [Puia sp.]